MKNVRIFYGIYNLYFTIYSQRSEDIFCVHPTKISIVCNVNINSKIAGCEAGTWGPGCQEKCDCKNNATCNIKTGKCECLAGWDGILCEHCKYEH